ncbi:acetyltransferase [Ancylobacter polymorphus]|uniref:Sugar O-acyltransferase (Sialic acid O-acetyltransferase NeuD family) n=1 Tax=Ancylobacter polymorphus TaxID=223390 RepID=A0ABU0BHT1_9HYPH|nr:acetyltransferase [Ancylobacter polymorphus]MDQ0304612.1 sugar O-acyltransferase (sialic acid O-acetyltransferase NeuD family) [Ancylobacter polymorphus]
MNAALLILGCGGHGRVVADTAVEAGYKKVAFLDDNPPREERRLAFPVLGALSLLPGLAGEWPCAIAALGDGARRLALFEQLRQSRFSTPTLIHPSAIISRGATIGEGVFVAAGAIINSGARIAEAAIINTGARIDHDCDIGTATHIAPGATLSGRVTVGAGSWIGTGASVRQNIRIGDGVTIGVGAAVVSDLLEAGTYAGVPARRLPRRQEVGFA